MSKQNLDNYFKQKFENIEEFPPEVVWENLEAQLSKKKKRRVIPFWWKFSGVAALFLLSFGLYTFYTDGTQNKTNNTIVVKEKPFDKNTTKANYDNSKLNINSGKTEVATIQNQNLETSTLKNNTTNSKFLIYKNANKTVKNQLAQSNTNIITNNNNISNNQSSNSEIAIKNNTTQAENKVVEITKTDSPAQKDISKDSTKIAQETQELEKLLKNEKESKIAGQKVNRWQLTPQVAPIYFGSTGNDSPLDVRLQDNLKQYNNSYSYGLGLGYAVSKKVQVRTGINYLTTNFDTNEVVYYQKSYASKIQNINPTPAGEMIEIQSLKNVTYQHNKIEYKNEGVINQEMAYIEMPVEVSYKVIDKKLGLNVISGISTLFLNQNNVYLKSSGFSMKIGEASNLNNINFSANIGLGLQYKIYKNFNAHIDPVFKYQLKTFSNDVGNFKPYVFGVYSGISFSF